MSLHFYGENEDISKGGLIDDYELFIYNYIKNVPSLEEALYQMFDSLNISQQKKDELVNDILKKSEKIIEFNFDLIKEKYPILTREEAKIISSYKCESIYPNYSPYKILNRNLCEINKEEGIITISKYLFLFLKSLRKLDKFYPKQKYMYRCIDKYVDLKENSLNEKIIPYRKGITKTFWGFSSISSEINLKYNLNGKIKEIKNGTIFDLYGNIWGYDISLFNHLIDEEIILEPQTKGLVTNVVQAVNDKFIHIRCQINDSPIIFKDLIKPDGIKIIYEFDIDKSQCIRIFGNSFVENNKHKCKFIYKEKEYDLQEFFEVDKLKRNKLEIILMGIENITDMSHLFEGCNTLLSIPNISKWNTSNVTNISYSFFNCKSLVSLPDISKWNTLLINDMSFLFGNCYSLKSLPDISKWNTFRVNKMSGVFYNCRSLTSLPDISKWNTSNVIDMRQLFFGCSSLTNLPNISKWKTNKVINMNSMFGKCSSLLYLPINLKWDTSNLIDINSMFYGCSSLLYLPNISKWNTSNIRNMKQLFYGCSSLTFLPDISKCDFSKVSDIKNMFNGCTSLLFMPNISLKDSIFLVILIIYIIDA